MPAADTVLTTGPKVSRWFARNLTHSMGPAAGTQFVLEDPQQDFINEFYSCHPDGERVYQVGLLGIPRGNGKSPIAAGLGLHTVSTRNDSPRVFAAAGSRGQAKLLLGFAKDFVEVGPRGKRSPLSPFFDVTNSVLSCPQRRGTMTVLSSDGSLQHGLSVSASLIDELHVFKTKKQLELQEALRTALHKRWNSFELSCTTSGEDEDTLLGEMYNACMAFPDVEQPHPCLTIARDKDSGTLMYWYGVPNDADWTDTALWRLANPASWVSVRSLEKQLRRPGLKEAGFRRLYLNQWVAATQVWLPMGAYRELQRPAHLPARGTTVYVGVDVARRQDTTAVAVAWRNEDGRIAWCGHSWTISKDLMKAGLAHEHHDYDAVQLGRIEDYIVNLRDQWGLHVVEVVYDARFFARSAELLEDRGFLCAELDQQSSEMGKAYSQFYASMNSGSQVPPSDPVVRRHCANATADETEAGWIVRKRKQNAKIDLLVAGTMAHYRAARAKRSVYDTRGVLRIGRSR